MTNNADTRFAGKRAPRRDCRRGGSRALEQVRITVLGKKGRVSELMATLGRCRRSSARRSGSRSTTSRLASARRWRARRATWSGTRCRRVSPPRTPTSRCRFGWARCGRPHPSRQPGLGRVVEIFADMGFAVAEGPDIETDDLNFTKLNIPPEHPARQEHDTFYFHPEGGWLAHAAAHAHQPRADPHHAEPEAADPHHRAGPRLSHRQRRHAHADVPPDRGAGHRRDDAPRPPQVGAWRSSARRSSRSTR